MGRNIDFFAVLFIALAMLGLARVRSWNFNDALDSIRVENAIHVESCPISKQVALSLSCLFR
jgi:hypothetical protein